MNTVPSSDFLIAAISQLPPQVQVDQD